MKSPPSLPVTQTGPTAALGTETKQLPVIGIETESGAPRHGNRGSWRGRAAVRRERGGGEGGEREANRVLNSETHGRFDHPHPAVRRGAELFTWWVPHARHYLFPRPAFPFPFLRSLSSPSLFSLLDPEF
ncbi:hypothetical protein C2845_PM02G14930 [Panicum miliaceum]|uniref:Uncharacterized protein n=1 Tax=Panicum miliaceum TaxID=4540 RepID=A0A3L6SGD4_PANMI|nr:hypothetical protein C2845_PM02G14930 [Panicum miliaceum]